MYEFHYKDIECLNIELPEDILKKKWFGDFKGAKNLIDIRLKSEIPTALRKKLELEKMVLSTLEKEYTIAFEDAFRMVKEVIHDFTKEEFLKYQEESKIDWIYVNGEVRYFRRFLSTLLKVNKELEERAEKFQLKQGKGEFKKESIEHLEKQALREVIRSLKEKKELTYHFKLRASVKIKEEAFKQGIVHVHIPIPTKCQQVSEVKILKVEPKETAIADEEQSQRTIYFETNLLENEAFTIEYEYNNKVSYVNSNELIVDVTKQHSEALQEQAPHIMFTPYLKSLTAEIIGEETNALKKARKIYDYVTTKIHYSFMREYFTIENIPEYAALSGKGDCGVQSLLFITLCRIAGIPARWQSGLYTTPYTASSHDWAQFYIAPYGWLFADCSYGGDAYRLGEYEIWDFYFGNIDPFRMPANIGFQEEFYPAKKFMRADPYDNQRGEIEYNDRGLAYNEFDAIREVLECYEI